MGHVELMLLKHMVLAGHTAQVLSCVALYAGDGQKPGLHTLVILQLMVPYVGVKDPKVEVEVGQGEHAAQPVLEL